MLSDERLTEMEAVAVERFHLISRGIFGARKNESSEPRLFTAADMRAQYAAGFRDGRASALPLDPKAPVLAGSV